MENLITLTDNIVPEDKLKVHYFKNLKDDRPEYAYVEIENTDGGNKMTNVQLTKENTVKLRDFLNQLELK